MARGHSSADEDHLMLTPAASKARRRRIFHLAPWLYGLALAFWASSWNLRLSILMAWMPVEPMWVASFTVALCVVHRFGRPLTLSTTVAGPLLLLVLGFLPGALNSDDAGYGPTKVATMIFVILPVVLAATVLLDSPEARRGWLVAQALLGTTVAVAALASNGSHVAIERFTLDTVETISTARPIGAAVVILVLLALTSWRHNWWALPFAALNGVVLVYVGSRGPALYALLTVAIVVVVARFFTRRRARPLLIVGAVSVLAYGFALVDGGAGGLRIVSSVRTDLYDVGREQLMASAIHLGLAHPMGIGWGDFARDSPVGRELANAQGVAYAHNSFAESFSEGGILALLAFVVVVVLVLTRLWRLSEGADGALVLGTTVYWLLNAQVSSDFVGNRFMWIAIACGLAATASTRPRNARYGANAHAVRPAADQTVTT
jgi:hypothetical protein